MLEERNTNRLNVLMEKLRPTHIMSSELMLLLMDEARAELSASPDKEKAIEQFDRLVKDGAWIDGIFRLLEIQLPKWRVQNLSMDNGGWLCSLVRGPYPPKTLSDMAGGRHKLLPLAMMSAYLEARERG